MPAVLHRGFSIPPVRLAWPTRCSQQWTRELLALLKAEPEKYSYASSGNGTPLHLSGELFKKMAGVEMQHNL
ncbi:tripartite-type tricarboxylate transporter receptor subunit TctC [Sinorhizobium meliloti]